ncbi:extracellular solute-binding protein [Paenibacillus eucommiae]|uniref:ABC-type glycerol-3-phosphate transport system substrate-binding protein n=1 Tax=Paenibacillus eucommiae TaxID=1355755 RepID=A0ABS4J1S4_9BACL|nr:extracellular solute-binding protein [Paenibacillus eucommiae]MBP1993787.1 ABC-type glycerol-3-phosphate transport system substrate-binding protein [Paenibacillus eucommiae]
MSKRKWFWAVPMMLVVLLLVLGGCSKENDGGANSPAPSTDSETNAVSTPKADEPPANLTFFYSNSGVPHPEGVDPNNNPFLDIVNKLANVKLKVEVPSYQEFETKFNLLMASGKLPDLVHTPYLSVAEKSGDDGAFIDLKKYYDNSPIIQKVISKEMMELTKSKSGHYYRIPMAWDKAPQGSGLAVRFDLLEKYNEGKFPATVEEYVDVMYKIKKANPKAIPMTNRVVGASMLTYGGDTLYQLLGAAPYANRIKGDQVIPNFGTPEFMKATKIMRQLYTDGILDKEFSTNSLDKWSRIISGDFDTLMEWNTADQMPYKGEGAIKNTNPLTKEARYVVAPPIQVDPVVSNPLYVESFKALPVIDHGVYISSTSKNQDAAWRVIEALASDELDEAIWYGFEGEHYTVGADGKKIVDFQKLEADKAVSWAFHLHLIRGFVSGQEAMKEKSMAIMGEEYGKFVFDSMIPMQQQADKNGIHPLTLVEPKLSDESAAKRTEMNEFISKALAEAIMSRISMEELDQRIAEFNTKYGTVFAELTQIYKDIKPELPALGVKVVNW